MVRGGKATPGEVVKAPLPVSNRFAVREEQKVEINVAIARGDCD